MITDNKKITIYKKNLFEKNDKLNNILEVSLKNIIKIKCYLLPFYELQKIIDSTIYFYKNYETFKDLLKNKKKENNRLVNVLSYFNKELLLKTPEKIPIIKSLIKLPPKKKSLLEIFYRITNNNFILLYKIIINKEIILHHICNHIKEKNSEKTLSPLIKVNTESLNANNNYIGDTNNDTDDTYDTSDRDDRDDTDDIKNNCKFYDIKDFLNQKLKKVDMVKSKGRQSMIEFYVLEKNMHYKIQNKVDVNIDNCIVKKNFIEYNEKVTLHLNGLEGQYNREVRGLLSVYKKKHFPILLSKNFKEKYIIMNYCGVPLTENNIPDDWKKQLNTIIDVLKSSKCSNNDMWKNNFLIKDDIIHLVDFGWSTINEYFPYINITKEDVDNHYSLFSLLDHTFERVIEKRILFRNSL